jgi:hypothetical protein
VPFIFSRSAWILSRAKARAVFPSVTKRACRTASIPATRPMMSFSSFSKLRAVISSSSRSSKVQQLAFFQGHVSIRLKRPLCSLTRLKGTSPSHGYRQSFGGLSSHSQLIEPRDMELESAN